MNAFCMASNVEIFGMAVLMPYLEEKAHRGRIVKTAKGALARFLQETIGDVVFNTDDETICCAEIKVEKKWTGNLFLETWSNRNLEKKESHAMRGSNPGWLAKTQADVLLYYFLDTDDLIALPVFTLKRWAFVLSRRNGHAGRIWDFEEKKQGKYDQLNDTWGRIVPVSVLEKEANAKRLSVLQLELFGRDAA